MSSSSNKAAKRSPVRVCPVCRRKLDFTVGNVFARVDGRIGHFHCVHVTRFTVVSLDPPATPSRLTKTFRKSGYPVACAAPKGGAA